MAAILSLLAEKDMHFNDKKVRSWKIGEFKDMCSPFFVESRAIGMHEKVTQIRKLS